MQIEVLAQADGESTNQAKETMEASAQVVDTLQGKFTEWLQQGIELLPNFLVAVAVLVVFAILAWIAKTLVSHAIGRMTSNQSIVRLVATLTRVAVLAVGLFVALEVMQLSKAVTSLLAGAGVIGIALAFAFQDLAANLVAGIYMSVKRPAGVGDIVETNDAFGKVQAIDLRNITLRTPDGRTVIIPNKLVFEEKLVNYSRSGEHRVEVECGVSYGDDLDTARQVAIEAVEGVEARQDSRDVEFFYTEFGGSSVNFMLRFWISYTSNADIHAARSDAMMRLKKALDEAGMTIPFPIRTLDFGIVGGEHLRDAWPTGESSDQGE